jgi:hypothetical protein
MVMKFGISTLASAALLYEQAACLSLGSGSRRVESKRQREKGEDMHV